MNKKKMGKCRGNKYKGRMNWAVPAVIAVAVVVIACIAVAVFIANESQDNVQPKQEPQIISKAMLEKILDVSELSTFEAVYNGITKVMDEEDEETVAYYVSYSAKVKAGMDFEKLEVEVDGENKIVSVKLPPIKITDVNVDITSLDYIFENDEANTATVSQRAYKKCIEDVTRESSGEDAIFELAEQNARNMVEALISPFVKQLDDTYQLWID